MIEILTLDPKIYESFKALSINVADSLKVDYSKELEGTDKYFVYARRQHNKDIFYSIVDKYYHEKNKFSDGHFGRKGDYAAYQYLAFKVFGVINEATAEIIKSYVRKDIEGVLFFAALDRLSEVSPEYKYKNEETKQQENIEILENLIVKYFRNYKKIMKQEEIDKHDYRYHFLLRKQHAKERIEKMAKDIDATLEYFSTEKKEEQE